MNPFLSIIIPTFNRSEKLNECLHRLHEQTLGQDAYEIWVVDDGSTDDTQAVLKDWEKRSAIVHVLHQKNAGQGVARNHALSQAKGQILLFLGDDIYATPDFLQAHVDFHKTHPEQEFACLGLTEWDPNQPVNKYMHWLTNGGPQFAYGHLRAGKRADFWFFYTSNLSLKKTVLKEDHFDESFKGYGWEDTELGYRLQKKGLQLLYMPQALAYHDHWMEESALKAKMHAIGKNARVFQSKHPELSVLPQGIKKFLLQLASNPLAIGLLKLGKKLFPMIFARPYWTLASKRYFLEGAKGL